MGVRQATSRDFDFAFSLMDVARCRKKMCDPKLSLLSKIHVHRKTYEEILFCLFFGGLFFLCASSFRQGWLLLDFGKMWKAKIAKLSFLFVAPAQGGLLIIG